MSPTVSSRACSGAAHPGETDDLVRRHATSPRLHPTLPLVDVERVGPGLLCSLGGVVAGAALTVVLWRLGFITAISAVVLAGCAVFLDTKGAGTTPRRGLAALLSVILVGVIIAFLACIASDLSDIYDRFAANDAPSKVAFVRDNLFRQETLSAYGKDAALFAFFAALGTFGTIRRLVAEAR